MICLRRSNQPGINADTSFGELTVGSPPSGAQFLAIGVELAGEVSLRLLLGCTFPPPKKEVHFSSDTVMDVQDMTAELAVGPKAN